MSTRILAIDTVTEACSAAVWNNGDIHSLYEICSRQHSQRILPFIQQVLKDANICLSDLDALAFSQGPGSFTGVRISIGISQGLALGAGLPMIGVSSLHALAQQAYRLYGYTKVLAAIDARMGEVYWAEYCLGTDGNWSLFSAELVLTPEQVNQRLLHLNGCWAAVGTGWRSYPLMAKNSAIELLTTIIELPTAEDMLPLAVASFRQGKMTEVAHSKPVYLRNKVAWKKRSGH